MITATKRGDHAMVQRFHGVSMVALLAESLEELQFELSYYEAQPELYLTTGYLQVLTEEGLRWSSQVHIREFARPQ